MNEEKIRYMYGFKLPEPLSKRETYNLINKINQGNNKALEILVIHNLKIVIYEVSKKFANFDCDKEELVAVGNVGLVKAIKTFDNTKNIEFSTYAIRCIDNEILMYLRKIKKELITESLDKTFFYGKDDDELKLKNTISGDNDEFEKLFDKLAIYQSLNELSERDKEIIMLYFGFYNKPYSQKDIAKIMNLSQSQICRIIYNNLKLLKIKLTETDNKTKKLNV